VFRKLKKLWDAPREKKQLVKELSMVKERISRQEVRIMQLGEGDKDPQGIRAESIIWIFGAGRTGSTWLSRMMGELEEHAVWNEPLVGALFGDLYYHRAKHLIGRGGKHYILGDAYRESWLRSIRAFVLSEATGRFPEATGTDRYLVVKEPNGSLGAPLLSEALPESRMILLIRDPRDVLSSNLDARRKGGWKHEERVKWGAKPLAEKNLDAFVRGRAQDYFKRIAHTKQAYEAHQGRKVLVRYEELRANTLATMRRIYSTLEIVVDEEELSQVVEKHSWENIPEEQKGEGKKYRKATPGGWREDLTPEQARIIEEVTRPLLEEHYP
jgi:hypothetical protein